MPANVPGSEVPRGVAFGEIRNDLPVAVAIAALGRAGPSSKVWDGRFCFLCCAFPPSDRIFDAIRTELGSDRVTAVPREFGNAAAPVLTALTIIGPRRCGFRLPHTTRPGRGRHRGRGDP